jgi:two-component system NarL family response regulator
MKAKRIRILIVDDHVMVRMGLASLLADEADFEVVGQARNGAEAEALYAEQLPDITLMDGMLPDVHGTEVVRRIIERHPSAAIVMISINETDEDIHMALSAGARGYVPKSHDQDVIIRAIRTVVAGGKFLPPELETRLRERNRSVSLSHRELEVLGMIAKGKANKEIADGLKLSNNTVKTHVARILEKLGACDRTRAVTIAIQRGLLRL